MPICNRCDFSENTHFHQTARFGEREKETKRKRKRKRKREGENENEKERERKREYNNSNFAGDSSFTYKSPYFSYAHTCIEKSFSRNKRGVLRDDTLLEERSAGITGRHTLRFSPFSLSLSTAILPSHFFSALSPSPKHSLSMFCPIALILYMLIVHYFSLSSSFLLLPKIPYRFSGNFL